MLVVISDLHLNDGTVCTSTDAHAADIFFTEIEDQIRAAGWRKDGAYVPIENVDIVMLGDIFDHIRSEKWLNKTIRPWDDVSLFAPIVTEINKDIIQENKQFLAYFKNASINGVKVTYPSEVAPYQDARHHVNVNLFYMVGNHDWFPYLDSPLLDELRQDIREAFGLSQVKFPWKIEEWNDDANKIHETCMAHRVYLQHGDQYDEFNYHKWLGRGASSLGDAIVIELITKFPVEVKKRITAKYPDVVFSEDFLKALEELDNVRPSTHSVIYLRNVIENLCASEHKKIVQEVFYECSTSIQKSKIFREVKSKDCISTFKLEALNFASKWSPTIIVRVVTAMVDLFKTSHEKAAEKESYVRSGKCDFVTYGHTHEQTTAGIGGRLVDNKLIPKIYINSATWRPVNIEINPEKGVKGFPYYTQKTMTWVAYFKDDERKGRHYEVWSGKLGTYL